MQTNVDGMENFIWKYLLNKNVQLLQNINEHIAYSQTVIYNHYSTRSKKLKREQFSEIISGHLTEVISTKNTKIFLRNFENKRVKVMLQREKGLEFKDKLFKNAGNVTKLRQG